MSVTANHTHLALCSSKPSWRVACWTRYQSLILWAESQSSLSSILFLFSSLTSIKPYTPPVIFAFTPFYPSPLLSLLLFRPPFLFLHCVRLQLSLACMNNSTDRHQPRPTKDPAWGLLEAHTSSHLNPHLQTSAYRRALADSTYSKPSRLHLQLQHRRLRINWLIKIKHESFFSFFPLNPSILYRNSLFNLFLNLFLLPSEYLLADFLFPPVFAAASLFVPARFSLGASPPPQMGLHEITAANPSTTHPFFQSFYSRKYHNIHKENHF